jgi:hypothetical protein
MPHYRSVSPGLIAAALLGLSGCQLDMGGGPSSAQAAPPSPNYATAAVASTAPARGACFTPDELTSVRERLVQQELAVVALQCLYPNKQRAYEGPYAAFLNKFNGDLTQNRLTLERALAKRGINFNAFVTEMTNRAGTRANIDPKFCISGKQALDWGLSPQVTKLSMVPPIVDVTPEMGVRPCATATK